MSELIQHEYDHLDGILFIDKVVEVEEEEETVAEEEKESESENG